VDKAPDKGFMSKQKACDHIACQAHALSVILLHFCWIEDVIFLTISTKLLAADGLAFSICFHPRVR
jgi:hypothetical protein